MTHPHQPESSEEETPLVLSLFPGIGLLDRGFEDEGFCVVRGPDLLWGGDVKKFSPPPSRFDGVIGGPPCKRFSKMAQMVIANGYELAEDLIPEFVRCVAEARPAWFLMENVPPAPLPEVAGYVVRDLVVNNRQFGGVQNRERRFSFGTLDGRRLMPRIVALEPCRYAHAVTSHARPVPVAINASGKRKSTAGRPARTMAQAAELQGLPDGFDLPGFTTTAAREAIGNGVPYPLARAMALAVREAMA